MPDVGSNTAEYYRSDSEPWRVTLVDTGAATMTGGRLRRVLPYVADNEALHDKFELEEYWASGQAPWKVWQ
jgi:hypothetical protein